MYNTVTWKLLIMNPIDRENDLTAFGFKNEIEKIDKSCSS